MLGLCLRSHEQPCAPGLLDEGSGEIPGTEGNEIVHLLSNPDKADRYLEGPGDGQHKATLCGTVEFRDDEAGDGDGIVKTLRLGETLTDGKILPGFSLPLTLVFEPVR